MLLALDLGLHCGWSLWGDGRYLASGVWHLGHDRSRDRGDEFLLRVLAKVQAHKVRRLAYEHIASIHDDDVDAVHRGLMTREVRQLHDVAGLQSSRLTRAVFQPFAGANGQHLGAL